MNLKYIKNFSDKKTKFNIRFLGEINLTRKQMFSLAILIFSCSFIFTYAQINGGNHPTLPSPDTVSDSIKKNVKPLYLLGGVGWIIDMVKSLIRYIAESQSASIATISKISFGSSSMFWRVINGIKYFAVVACAYKIVLHFINTEKYDNAKAFTGFFGYAGVLILFIFSNNIVSRLADLNSSINRYSIDKITSILDKEFNQVLERDYKKAEIKLNRLNEEYEHLGMWSKIGNRLDYHSTVFTDLYLNNTLKYIYMSFFSLLLGAVLAIPAFVMTFMVKILLSVMVAGTQIVFLLAFIPGFENTWKQFLLNMLNILLWIPIFNTIMTFIIAIIQTTISEGSMETGQIIWLAVVGIILCFQAVSLSTSAAGTIINGAGAGMAGAMSSMSSLSATSVIANTATTAISVGSSAATGGASIPNPKFSKD